MSSQNDIYCLSSCFISKLSFNVFFVKIISLILQILFSYLFFFPFSFFTFSILLLYAFKFKKIFHFIYIFLLNPFSSCQHPIFKMIKLKVVKLILIDRFIFYLIILFHYFQFLGGCSF